MNNSEKAAYRRAKIVNQLKFNEFAAHVSEHPEDKALAVAEVERRRAKGNLRWDRVLADIRAL